MDVSTQTATLLLEGLQDSNNALAWEEFDIRYRPIVLGFVRSLGLDENDAADVAQETLVRFLKAYRGGQYDRSRGRLRSWIIGIAKYRVLDRLKSRAPLYNARGDSALAGLPADQALETMWDQECRRAILIRAVSELRSRTRLGESTIQAFELLAFHDLAPAQVARRIGMTLDDVYHAKNRVAGKLREIIGEVERMYEVEEAAA